MKMKMGGSIYQSNGAGPGLIVQDGRLVNNRPDGMTGIQQVAMARKIKRHENKVNTYAEGYVRAERITDANEMMMDMVTLKNC